MFCVVLQQALFLASFVVLMIHCAVTPFLIGSANMREVLMLAAVNLSAGFEMLRISSLSSVFSGAH